jgi:hypothetical protein
MPSGARPQAKSQIFSSRQHGRHEFPRCTIENATTVHCAFWQRAAHFRWSKQSGESLVTQDKLPDPFGESHLVATLPPSSSALGLKGAALLIALAILLLVVRGLVG